LARYAASDFVGLQQLEGFTTPRNEADRSKYEVIRDRYSSDMSDAAFERIARPPIVRLGVA
jgi:hypothetical protein